MSEQSIDPVCGMKVVPQNDVPSALHKGKNYFFCSNTCEIKFIVDPDKYIKKQTKVSEAVIPQSSKVIYTCPMHPEIRKDSPGICPICGMALEPIGAVTGDNAAESHELHDMQRRFWISLFFTVPLFIYSMAGLVPSLGLHNLLPMSISMWIQFGLATPVVLWGGFPFFVRAVASLRTMNLNMFTLIGLGVAVAYVSS